MCDLPGSGIELESPALAGGFFPAEPPTREAPSRVFDWWYLGNYEEGLWEVNVGQEGEKNFFFFFFYLTEPGS